MMQRTRLNLTWGLLLTLSAPIWAQETTDAPPVVATNYAEKARQLMIDYRAAVAKAQRPDEIARLTGENQMALMVLQIEQTQCLIELLEAQPKLIASATTKKIAPPFAPNKSGFEYHPSQTKKFDESRSKQAEEKAKTAEPK